MSTLYMIRHGQASFGEANYDKLSEEGILQSGILAEYMHKTGIRFNAIYTGQMLRHKETLQELLDNLKQEEVSVPTVKEAGEFNEYDSGGVLAAILPEMIKENPELSKDTAKLLSDQKTFQRIFEEAIFRWISGNYKSKEITSWEDFTKRVNRGIDMIMESHGSGENIAVFTSGGPISVTVQRALNLSGRDAIRISWQIINSSVTRFKFTSDRIMLAVFNDHSHLENFSERNLITYR